MHSSLPPSMTWQKIADGLRAELMAYGGLLALFAEQQKFLFEREASHVLRISGLIEQQVVVLDDSRRQREALVAVFAVAHAQPASATLRSLLPFIEAPAQPLFEALLTEINHLLHRVRRTNRHNHTLLTRAVEVHAEVLQVLQPDNFTRTYSPAGRLATESHVAAGSLQAAG